METIGTLYELQAMVDGPNLLARTANVKTAQSSSYRQEQKNSSLVSILVALLNGMNLTQRLDLHRLSQFLRKNFCQLSAPLQNLFSGFMTQWDYHTLLSLEWVSAN